MKFTNLHWGFALLLLAAAVFSGIVLSEEYLARKGGAKPTT
ncbi:MAG: hypothetical protein R2824_15830 [Saprospiraceae bacterium]